MELFFSKQTLIKGYLLNFQNRQTIVMNRQNSRAFLAAATIQTVAVALSVMEEEERSLNIKRKQKKRHYVMKRAYQEEMRNLLGHQNVLAEMRLKDPSSFQNYLRMTTDQFDKLLNIVGSSITKSIFGPTMPINPSTRLAITIRYLLNK